MENSTAEVRERAQMIREAAEEEHGTDEHFRNRTAIYVAVLAILLAISSFNTASYVRQVINTNIHANANESLFHIKNLEQTAHQLAADELKVTLQVDRKRLQPKEQALLQQEIERFEAETARLESDPASGEGKEEIHAAKEDWEARHHGAEEHLMSFESADIIFQVAIVLCSVCIVLKSRRLLQVALTFGSGAVALLVNGFFLWVKL